MTTPTRTRPRQGFTLVEMLVVIVIIGILAGLITAAVFRGRTRAREAVIKIEMAQLEMALESYKTDIGDYPPDCVFLTGCTAAGATEAGKLQTKAQNDILRHLRKRFPRYVPTGYSSSDPEWKRFCDDVKKSYPLVDPNTLDPSSALLFFLGGLPEQSGGDWVPAGFHSDPTNPFRTGGPRTKPYFEFARERIEAPPAFPTLRFYPRSLEKPPAKAPYVYFKARSREYGATDSGNTQVFPSVFEYDPTNNNICVAYLEPPSSGTEASWKPNLPSSQRLWRNAAKFQLICAGLDGQFGAGHLFRYTKTGVQIKLDGTVASPSNWDDANSDNLTNFAEGTLGDEIQ